MNQAHRYGGDKLMLCSSGNLSWRQADGTALISGTGSWVPNLSQERVAMCDIATGESVNGIKPSMESTFHLGIMRERGCERCSTFSIGVCYGGRLHG